MAAIVLLTAAASGALLVMGLVDPGRALPGADAPAARTLGYYQAVRSVVLIGAAVWLLARRQPQPLRVVLILNAATQAGDATVGLLDRHSLPETLGPVCFAVALAYAARRLRPASVTRPAGRSRREALLLGAPRLRRPRTR